MIHVVGVRTEITQNIGGSLAAVFLSASFTWMIRILGVLNKYFFLKQRADFAKEGLWRKGRSHLMNVTKETSSSPHSLPFSC